MSYKKIVAGIATAAIASALVVPAAFAAPIEQDDYYPEFTAAQAAAKQDVDDAEDALVVAKAALKAAEVEGSQEDVDALRTAYEAAEAALAAAKANPEYEAYLNLEKVWDNPVYKDARKSADKHAKNSLERGHDVLDDLDETDLVSLKKIYDQQARAIEQGARKLKEQMAELGDYKDMMPNRVEVLARELDQTEEYLISLLRELVIPLPQGQNYTNQSITFVLDDLELVVDFGKSSDRYANDDYYSEEKVTLVVIETPKSNQVVKPTSKKASVKQVNKNQTEPVSPAIQDSDTASNSNLNQMIITTNEVEKVREALFNIDTPMRDLINQKFQGQDYASVMLDDPENPGEKISLEEFIKRVEVLKHEIYLLTYRLPDNWLEEANAKLELLRKYLSVLEASDGNTASTIGEMEGYFQTGNARMALLVSAVIGMSIALLGVLLVPFKRKKEQDTTEELREGELVA